MDAENLQRFVEQTESSLPKIRGSLIVCAGEKSARGTMNSAISELGVVKYAASQVGFEEIEKSAAELGAKLKSLAASETEITEAQTHSILDELAALETLVAKINFSLDDFSLDISDFVDDYFDHIQIQPELPKVINEKEEVVSEIETEEDEEEATDDFEIDEEMLEVFALEAEELIQNINVNLKTLENARQDREALLEIRRSAHTLKGSAGIVGLKKLSRIAHRVEDLLDYLAENEIDADDRVFELLPRAIDCFEALANGEESAQLTEKISRLYKSCDEILASLKKNFDQPNDSATNFESKTETKAPVEVETKEAQTQIAPTQNRSIVRVSLEKLDDLVRCVSDLVVSRSVFEQRLNELERQNEELRHIANRLQFSAAKLEIDFEADTTEIQSSRFKSPGSPAKLESSSIAVGNAQSFDSLEFDRYTEFHQITRELIETAADNSAVHADMTLLKSNFEILFDSQRILIDEMQDKLLHLRMVSFDLLSVRLRRTVRVTCDEEAKFAELFIEGENLEIDTQILDSLVEPLLHLLRNAVAHGIELPELRRMVGKPETGKISLRVYSDGTHLILNVTDDGRGISAAALKEKAVENKIITLQDADAMSEEEAFALVFLPGLTTAEKLSQVSGRGVGMNIVKAGIVRRQGTISIHSEAQKGTTFTIRLPLPLAITLALPVKSAGQAFAFPLKFVKEATKIPVAAACESVKIGDREYRVAHLNNLLGLPPSAIVKDEEIPVLLIENAGNCYALIVDEILKPEEIVIKRLGLPLQNFAQLLGAATLGNGNVIPVLDLLYLLERQFHSSKLKIQNQPQTQDLPVKHSAEIEIPKPKILNILVVDDSPSVRHLTTKVIKAANMKVIVAKDGLEALENLQSLAELPDVILTDVEMPRMDGYQLLASLKKQENLRAIPVVMITSRAGDKHRRKAYDLGVSAYMTKPFEDSFLVETIKKLTEN